MSEPTLSAFVKRCQAAMAKYQELRFLGMSHELARQMSAARDVRKIVAGDAE